jgi:hypothetical protein
MMDTVVQLVLVAVVSLIGTLAGNRVSLAVMKRDITELQTNDKDKESRLRTVEHSTTVLEARAGK